MKQTIILLVLIVIAGLGLWWINQDTAAPETENGNTQITQNEEGDTSTTDDDQNNNEDDASSDEMNDKEGDGSNDGTQDETQDTQEATVTYTNSGFAPQNLEVSVGTTVTFVNEGSGRMWVGVDEHPSHTQYDGTSRSEHCSGGSSNTFDQCSTGDTYSFTFDEAGTWDYHNHVNAAHGGTITVTQ